MTKALPVEVPMTYIPQPTFMALFLVTGFGKINTIDVCQLKVALLSKARVRAPERVRRVSWNQANGVPRSTKEK